MRFVMRTLITAGIGLLLVGCGFGSTPAGFTNATAGSQGSTAVRAPSSPFPGVGFVAAPPNAGTPFSTP